MLYLWVILLSMIAFGFYELKQRKAGKMSFIILGIIGVVCIIIEIMVMAMPHQ